MNHTGTQTYHILHNFPSEIQQQILDVWKAQQWKEVKEVVNNKFWHYVLDNSNKLYEHFPYMDCIEYYEVAPGMRNSPHLDRGRWCALNFPVEVDYDNSFFHCGKYFWLGHYKLDEEKVAKGYTHTAGEKGPKGFYLWEENLMDKYSLEKPVFFSTKVPHGGDNKKSNTKRVICSIGCTNYTYDQVIHMLPPEWF